MHAGSQFRRIEAMGGCPADTVCFQGREAQPGEDGGGIIPVFHQILFYVQGIDTDAVLIQML